MELMSRGGGEITHISDTALNRDLAQGFRLRGARFASGDSPRGCAYVCIGDPKIGRGIRSNFSEVTVLLFFARVVAGAGLDFVVLLVLDFDFAVGAVFF